MIDFKITCGMCGLEFPELVEASTLEKFNLEYLAKKLKSEGWIVQINKPNKRKTMQRTRAEHLQWCKDRALEYAKNGDYQQALASMTSDLSKHEETRGHPGAQIGLMMAMSGNFNRPGELEKWINGFN